MNKKTLLVSLLIIFLLLGATAWYVVSTANKPTAPGTITLSPSSSTISTNTQEVAIISTPQGATVSIDGQNIGTTPIKYTFQQKKSYQILATKSGYIPLYLNYQTTDQSSLRLQLAPQNTLPTATNTPTPSTIIQAPSFTAIATPSAKPTNTTLPSPTIVPFPTQPDLRILSVPNYTYTYTSAPTATAAPSSTPAIRPQTSSAIPTVSPTTASKPSAIEISRANELMANYSGVHDFSLGDGVEEGTAGETGVVISDRWFYPDQLQAFVAYPIRFINDSSGVCILHVQNSQGDTVIGTLQKRENLLFTVPENINETMHFSCQSGSQAGVDIAFFS